ncbi:unnamed protein product [Prunus brigantina]
MPLLTQVNLLTNFKFISRPSFIGNMNVSYVQIPHFNLCDLDSLF